MNFVQLCDAVSNCKEYTCKTLEYATNISSSIKMGLTSCGILELPFCQSLACDATKLFDSTAWRKRNGSLRFASGYEYEMHAATNGTFSCTIELKH